MSRILVTGASGFFGQVLCRELRQAGWEVRGTFHRGSPAAEPGVEWRRIGSISGSTDWSNLLDGTEAVVHAAAVAHRIGPKAQVADAVYDEVNHRGTARLAAAARAAGVRRFVFVSSIGAVTDASAEPVDEATPCFPATPYGRSKLAAERAVASALAGGDCEWCILRPPLLYGPGNPGNMERLLRLLRLPVPLPLGGLRNCRSFLYVLNLADAVKVALAHPAAAGEVFCLADDEMLSTSELLRALGRAAGRPVRLFGVPAGVLEFMGRLGDGCERLTGRSPGLNTEAVRKLRSSLPVSAAHFSALCGWRPPFRLIEGLAATVANGSHTRSALK